MSRPTLKLPAKGSSLNRADGSLSPSRKKPVRAGAKQPKQSVAQRAHRSSVQWPRSEKNGESSPRCDEPLRTAPVVNQESSRRDVSPPEPPKKVYPKRGIARSTGARAFPPAPVASEFGEPRRNPERREAIAPPVIPVPIQREASSVPIDAAPDRVRRPLHEPPRLSKRISEMAQCSRREADEWIENGWIKVDGAVVTTLGTRVHPNAKVEIRDEASRYKVESVTILLNKPLDLVSVQAEAGVESPLQWIRPENRWLEDDSRCAFKASHLRGLSQVGKLDEESTGMLVFTQEGSVARRITGDDTRLEKEYMVRVEGELFPDGMKLLNYGLSLDEIKLKRAQVSWQSEQQLRFVLHESKKRQIQRMCELVGLNVLSIKRIRIGSVSLGKLPAGKWRYLRENERF